ncbi:MAG: C4-type zinc ribbon domain-containing protein [Cytophagales bacterium]|nr:C4-type zinc ribbon domain-containing protein [Cytophagales bacterium]
MEASVSKKLKVLLELQGVDSSLDEIKKSRGALPEEIRDLDDERVRFQTRLERQEERKKEIEQQIADNKTKAKDAEKLVAKYTEQQLSVRNNREYDSLTKEIELQTLEGELMEKRNRDNYALLEDLAKDIQKTQEDLKRKTEQLESKEQELSQLTQESRQKEEELLSLRKDVAAKLEDRLLASYERKRKSFSKGNGLVVVKVQREACGGCFNLVPPQSQEDILEKKKIMFCEHCGRIFAGVILSKEEKKARAAARKS